MAVLISGCGTREYERRRQAWLESYVASPATGAADGTSAGTTPSDPLYAATTLPGTTIRIRLPRSLKTVFNEASRIGGNPVPPVRLRPPFDLPGFLLCYEGTAALDSRSLPFYCYLAVVAQDYRGPQGATLEEQLAAGVRAATDAVGSWQTVDCPKPGGGRLSCRRLQSEGDQTFYIPAEGAEELIFGWLQIYLVPQGDQQLIVVWRAPTDILQETQLATLAPLSVGTTAATAD